MFPDHENNNCRQIIIYAPDFKPMVGGVAEYTFHLAYGLYQVNLLKEVVTPVPQNKIYDFPVIAPKIRNIIIKKINSSLYLTERYLIKLSTLFKVKRQDGLVIINWLESSLSYDFIKNCQKSKIKYALILHGKEIITGNRKNSHYFNRICEQAELLIFNSKATYNLFQETTLQSPSKSYILNPGIECNTLDELPILSREELESKLSINLHSKIVVSTVSRLVKRKGIDLALMAIAPLLKSNSELVYLIGGTGEEYDYLKQLIHELNISEQAHILGSISEEEKYSLLNISSIFLMPNHGNKRTDFEGFGISFIEASYFRNVVIGGRSGGAVEAIAPGVSGFVIDTDYPSAIEKIREHLDYLISYPAERNRIAESGHHYVIQNFQAPKLVAKFASHLTQMDLSK